MFSAACLKIFLAVIALVGVQAFAPEQIRIQMTGDNRHVISWTTCSSANKLGACTKGTPRSVVEYGYSPTTMIGVVEGESIPFTWNKYSSIVHNVVLPTNNLVGKRLYYRVGDSKMGPSALSSVRSFEVKVPKKWAVFGDYGLTNIERAYDALVDGAKSGQFDAVFHVGDIAYDLHNFNGLRGDQFLNDLEPISSIMPYMFAVGNHEKEGNFTHYVNRFSSQNYIGKQSKADTSLWYSFKQPLVHYTVVNTEVTHYFPSPGQQQRQFNWLRADLAQANKERGTHPWLIVYGHKCDWHDMVNFDEFLNIFHTYGVDLYICGHQHNYERLYPGLKRVVQKYDNPNVFVDPKYWTQVVVGSPGCQENISKGSAGKTRSAKQLLTYGYGILQVHNATHLEWSFMQTNLAQPQNGNTFEDQLAIAEQNEKLGLSDKPQVMDHMWLIQHNHGPRKV